MVLPSPTDDEKRREFIARFMASAEARKEFPDPAQRRAVAESTWRRRVSKRDYYSLAKAAFTACCLKQDVPEVEAVIGLLQRPLEALWRRRLQEALGVAVDRLRELEDELPTSAVDGLALVQGSRGKRNERLLVAAFLAALDDAARAPMPARIEALLTRATEELLQDGARSQSLTLDLAREPLARAAARADLRTLIAGRLATRQQELREQVEEFLRSKRARTPALPGDITEPAPGFRASNLQEWLERNTKLVGLDTSEWLPAVVDQWAYRWFVVGQFLSGVQAGFTELIASAVIDGKTTPFCRWVNGRVLSVRGAQLQLDRHTRAALQNDIESLMDNWPMLSSKVVQSESPSDLRRAFASVGLPPYHFLCRTTIRWVR